MTLNPVTRDEMIWNSGLVSCGFASLLSPDIRCFSQLRHCSSEAKLSDAARLGRALSRKRASTGTASRQERQDRESQDEDEADGFRIMAASAAEAAARHPICRRK